MLDMGHDFVDETLGIRREKAFWMPRNACPASDRGITADQRPRQHARLLNRDWRWNDGDAVAAASALATGYHLARRIVEKGPE